MNKDWVGNKASTFVTLAASNHSNGERELNDYYATEPKAVEMLLSVEKFNPNIWECACGEGHISKELKKAGYNVWSTDLINRGYGEVKDFFSFKTQTKNDLDIITNPPYRYAKEFVEHALEIVQKGCKVAMLLKIQFLEGRARKKLFENYPPKIVYVFSSRVNCAKNGNFEKYKSSAVCYAWFVWEKGFQGKPKIDWLIDKEK